MLTAAEGGSPLAGLGSRVGPVGLGVREPGWGMELAVTLLCPEGGGFSSRKGVGSGAGTAQTTGRGSKF